MMNTAGTLGATAPLYRIDAVSAAVLARR